MLSRAFRGGVVGYRTYAVVVRNRVKRPTALSSLSLLSRDQAGFDVTCCRILCTWPNECFPPPTQWGYRRSDGPSTWPKRYPQAGGQNQSPVDIKTDEVQPAPELKDKPLTWNYASQICKTVVNSGCGWRVDVDPDGDIEADLMGGPLEHGYKFVQFHSHWGNATDCGSEHTVDGKKFAGELHFVHWNTELYSKCSEAVSATTGLTVLGVFLEIGEANPDIEKLCEAVKSISYKDQRTDLPPDFDPSYLFPVDQSYWTYNGSLTTPPCYESVTWIVFKQPITVSEEQLECFREMHCHCEPDPPPGGEFQGLMKLNTRPPQDLNDRVIRECSFS